MEIPTETVEKMEMELVLNWVNSLPDVKGNQIFVVKGFDDKFKKHMFCVFFAQDSQPFLGKDDPKKCFLCNELNQGILDVFKGNDIYLIPFEG